MKMYQGEKDAIKIIENIFHRQNYDVTVKEHLSERLERIVAREKDMAKVVKK